MAVLLALCAAIAYGAADFCGGMASRRTPAATVVLLSQVAGAAVLAVAWIAIPGAGRFYADDAAWGVCAGFAGGVAIVALYAALAVGRMGVVSPITAVVGATIPVLVGFGLGQRPATTALAGVALAFVAVALVSIDEETRGFSLRAPGVGLALVSGLAIGGLYVFLSRGHSDGGLSRLTVTRAVSVLFLAIYTLARREKVRAARGSLRLILAAGALDMTANVLYVLAARTGLLAIVAVLTSLYPASTVLLARIVLHERLRPVQWCGVGVAIAGVGLIALAR